MTSSFSSCLLWIGWLEQRKQSFAKNLRETQLGRDGMDRMDGMDQE